MTEGMLIDLARRTFVVMLEISLPILGAGMVVGLLISIFQAATSIQEMTLTFVPKIFAVVLTAAIFGPWMFTVLLQFTFTLFTGLPDLVR